MNSKVKNDLRGRVADWQDPGPRRASGKRKSWYERTRAQREENKRLKMNARDFLNALKGV